MLKIKKDDNVMIIAGSDRGKRGKVLLVDSKKNRVVVEGVNVIKKFVRPNQENPKGGLLKIEYPINLSNVMLFCDKCKKRVRTNYQLKNKVKTRSCQKCGKSFD